MLTNVFLQTTPNLGIPGFYKLVKVTVNGEVKDVQGYILRLLKKDDQQEAYLARMSMDGIGIHLDGTIEKTGIDDEGDLYRYYGTYSRFGISGKQRDDGELIKPGIFKIKRMKLNDNGELTIIAPEEDTILQFKRETPEKKP